MSNLREDEMATEQNYRDSMGDIYCKVAWFAMVADVANAASDLWEVLS